MEHFVVETSSSYLIVNACSGKICWRLIIATCLDGYFAPKIDTLSKLYYCTLQKNMVSASYFGGVRNMFGGVPVPETTFESSNVSSKASQRFWKFTSQRHKKILFLQGEYILVASSVHPAPFPWHPTISHPAYLGPHGLSETAVIFKKCLGCRKWLGMIFLESPQVDLETTEHVVSVYVYVYICTHATHMTCKIVILDTYTR